MRSLFLMGGCALFLLLTPSALGVVPSTGGSAIQADVVHESLCAQKAEAEVTLRKLKSGQFAEEEGLDFLEQVQKIRVQIGKQ